jgi:hypothetical protein
MDISKLTLDFSNLNINDFHAVPFALQGILIVFCSLLLLSWCISLLPVILGEKQPSTDASEKPCCACENHGADKSANGMDEDVLLAIATAVSLELERMDDNQKITWQRHGAPESPWLVSGRYQSLEQGTMRR